MNGATNIANHAKDSYPQLVGSLSDLVAQPSESWQGDE